MILKLKPILFDKVWGGNNLKKMYGYDSSNQCGEAWGISAHEHGSSIILNTEFSGLTLKQLFDQRKDLFGYYPGSEFPILVKLIDAKQNLSIQVHPDNKIAQKYNSLGKEECWYVLSSQKNAEIIIGHHGNKEDWRQALEDHKVEKLLNSYPIHKDDFFYIKAGTVHAICQGTTILEVQQSSDITFRLYDYNRLSDGKPRELHVEEGLEAMQISNQRIVHESLDTYFKYDIFEVDKYDKYIADSYGDYMFIIEGEGMINDEQVKAGDFIMASASESYEIEGHFKIQRTRLVLSRDDCMYIIGVDGGGTKTSVAIFDINGQFIGAKSEQVPSSIDTTTCENSAKHIYDIICAILKEHQKPKGPIASIFIGVGGIANESDSTCLKAYIKKWDIIGKNSIIEIKNDIYNAYASGLSNEAGVAFIIGTGSVGFGMNEHGDTHRTGGYSANEGDPGSAFYLGRLALKLLAKALDGRVDWSPFVQVLADTVDAHDYVSYVKMINSIDRTRTAQLAKVVTTYADKNDEIALGFIDKATDEIILMLQAIYKKLDVKSRKIAVIGSLGNADTQYKRLLVDKMKRIDAHIEVKKADVEPVIGSSILAANNINTNILM